MDSRILQQVQVRAMERYSDGLDGTPFLNLGVRIECFHSDGN